MTGGCQCGAVRFSVVGPPRRVYVCHCRECQKQSASAHGISVIVAADALTVIRGTPRCWTRAAASGGRVACWFCGACGGRLWHADGDDPKADISVKGGALDQPPDLTGAAHIWTDRRLPGVLIPADAPQWPQEPPG